MGVPLRACTAAAAAYHVDLRVRVAHVAHNGAVFHPVQLVSGHHVLVPWKKKRNRSAPIEDGLLKCFYAFLEARLEVQFTRARDDNIDLTDDLVQLDHSESIHAEANEEGGTG